MPERQRITAALVVLAVCIVFSLTAWVDPLEGVVGVFAGVVGTWVVRLIGKVRIPVFTWIATSFTTLVCTVIWIGLLTIPPAAVTTEGNVTASIPEWIWSALWVYRASCVALVAGLVLYLVVHINALRATKRG